MAAWRDAILACSCVREFVEERLECMDQADLEEMREEFELLEDREGKTFFEWAANELENQALRQREGL